MLDFSSYIDLPLIWAGIIVFAVFLYVLLDGFDLGVGILFPFAPSDSCRNKMMNSVAPFWDGNETWLVLGGGGLLAAFPLAYAIIMPALYIPIIVMLLGLIFRGVAFEFRFKATADYRKIWDYAFHFGSLTSTFFQGVILGAIVGGIKVSGRTFAGGSFDWLTPFSVMTGIALIFGYALLGATWLVMKTEDETQRWARKSASYVIIYVYVFMALVSLWVPFMNDGIKLRWFSLPNFFYLLPIPILTFFLGIRLYFLLVWRKTELKPFIYTILLFMLCYAGLAISLWPWIVPYQVPYWEAAASPKSQSLLLIGVLLLLPFILGYTIYSYYVFRGKSTDQAHY
jgi:cytochrome d ubiquinol oxidase subunit II